MSKQPDTLDAALLRYLKPIALQGNDAFIQFYVDAIGKGNNVEGWLRRIGVWDSHDLSKTAANILRM